MKHMKQSTPLFRLFLLLVFFFGANAVIVVVVVVLIELRIYTTENAKETYYLDVVKRVEGETQK